MYNTNSQIKIKTTTLKSRLCDYSDAYILVKGTINLVEQEATAATVQANRNCKMVIFKNMTPFTDCVTEINKTQIDDVKDLDVVVSIYNLIEYSNNSGTTRSLWQYCKDEQRNT